MSRFQSESFLSFTKPSILASAMVVALLLSCTQESNVDDVDRSTFEKESHSSPVSHIAPLSVDQKAIAEKYGSPDSFRLLITKEDLNQVTKVTRTETWNYYRLKVGITFINGKHEADEEIEDVPDWTLLPVGYRPEQFTNEMSLEEVKNRIIGQKPYESLDVPDDFMPGVPLQIIGFEQIVLGFTQGKLIYAQSIPLFPSEEERDKGEGL